MDAKFRMDAFNVFNHINAGNPSRRHLVGTGPINSKPQAACPTAIAVHASLNSHFAFSSNSAKEPQQTARGSFGSPLLLKIASESELSERPALARRDCDLIDLDIKKQELMSRAFAAALLFACLTASVRAQEPQSASGAEAVAPPPATVDSAQALAAKGRLDQAMTELDQLAASIAGTCRRGAAAGHHLLSAGAVSPSH